MSSLTIQVVQSGNMYFLDPVMTELITVANQYLESMKIKGNATTTVRSYAYDLLNLVRWLEIKKLDFSKVTDRDVFSWIEFMKESNLKAASINRRLSTCYSFFSYCYGDSIPKSLLVPYSRKSNWSGARKKQMQGVAGFWRKPKNQLKVKGERRLIDPLTADEVKDFLNHSNRYRDIGIILLMLFCGLRSCEVLSLKLLDFDFERGRLKVLGKGNKERMLPFPDKLSAVIKRYMRYERPPNSSSGNLFVILQGKRRGNRMTSEGLRKVFRYKREISNVKRANAHLWRHSFGTNMARQGVQLPTLQKMMGHASFKMTLRYINLAMNDVAAEYDKAITIIEKKYLQD